MIENIVEEAKIQFLKTGRLNRKVIRDEIALSWYRCRLNNLDFLKTQIRDDLDHSNNDLLEIQTIKIQNLLKAFNKDKYNTFMINLEGIVIEKIVYEDTLDLINNFAEDFLGTSAASLSLKSEEVEHVSYQEHFLDVFRHFNSYAFPIQNNDQVIGFLVIFTKVVLPDDEIQKIKYEISNRSLDLESIDSIVDSKQASYSIEQFLVVTDEQSQKINKQVDKMNEVKMPIYIFGPKGSGKSHLAWYIGHKILKMTQFLDMKKLPSVIRDDMIENALSQYDTLIIDSIEVVNTSIQKMLTVYSEEKFINKSSGKYSDYRCSNIILTTVYNPKELIEIFNFNERFVNRFSQHVISTVEFADPMIDTLKLDQLLDRYNCDFSDGFKKMLLKLSQGKRVDEVAEILENSVKKACKGQMLTSEDLDLGMEKKFITLAELERDYTIEVFKTFNENMTLTAEVLGIGRSTLYRKLKSYQIETKSQE